MNSRTSSIIGWVAAAPVILFNIFAAVMKFMPVAPGSPAEEMGQKLGLTPQMDHVLGVLEFAIVILYVIPRTSTVGFVLMVGYMAGALATNLTHGFTNLEASPIYIAFVLMTISAYFRNPELTSRLFGRKV